ncbi:conserved Plasmodium protein, unknown function [Plasmodium berghei]|uniref:CLAMP domain-containing protein, putative n=2 Tax=Plasmodium berghei TaxID=5821 RepID=A0A509AMT2_PLABA|nr:CLAMP domain-containing protein, putative [Plasmodium berghei ANKA]SCM24237.1 conserved Plasmodium protein, unknown function [Plasmodium berghei]SCN27019.1 conserved Plasmodium protein, unknown function [Plasmodium berghei]SCO61464.1 conserved Plasmodium protein, unknown function [Plasmodium berghei]SCO63442.1 conserved Plasmodium protein, unknown function [Plasmodium berghei]VUC56850.1 CLAMP domain-containing protein, putative [Plasmodium berghei ANKA]|eukprot:XP_034422636.1 CLAMP domain-containing protein, putative [Plasmodium berghei ANKA]
MEEIDVKFFTYIDIRKKDMRKIITMCNKKKQKKILIKKLKMNFGERNIKINANKKKTFLRINNFLPVGISNEQTIEEIENDQENFRKVWMEKNTTCLYDLSLYNIDKMKKKKMEKIVTDLFYNTLIYCIGINLSIREISTFLSIQKYIFLKLVNGYENIINIFLQFKNIILKHSINRKPNYIKIFSYSSIKLLIKYSMNNFFKKFAFYKFIFNPIYKINFECQTNQIFDFDICDDQCYDIRDTEKLNEKIKFYNFENAEELDRVKDLVKLNVGNVSNFENKNNDNFEKDFQNYLDKYNIKKGLNIFEVNKYKNDKNLQKVFNSIKKKSNYPTKFCENCEAQKKKNLEKDISKEQLIKKINNLYNDLEERIITRLNILLGN